MSQLTEDTPLLSSSRADGPESSSDESYPPTVEIHQKQCARAIFVLTWLSALLTVSLLVFHMIAIAINYGQAGNTPSWEQELGEAAILCTLITTGLISFLNLARLYLWDQPMWLWLNLILDIIIVIYAIGIGLQTIGDYGWGSEESSWFNNLIFVLSGLAIILGLIHLALFLVRCFLSFSYRPWRGYRNWSFPSGCLSVEFKVKFVRQAENTEASLGETTDGQAIQREAGLERV